MDFREFNCPHCGELMQVPAGRRTLICMYCGKDIYIQDADKDEPFKSSEELLDIIREDAKGMFSEAYKYNGIFSGDKYDKALEEFSEEHRAILDSMYELYVYCEKRGENKDETGRRIGDCVAHTIYESASAAQGRKMANRANLELNLFMVSYVFPAILSRGEDTLMPLCQDICKAWKNYFPKGDIAPASSRDISKGFKKGIFGLFKGWF